MVTELQCSAVGDLYSPLNSKAPAMAIDVALAQCMMAPLLSIAGLKSVDSGPFAVTY